MTKVSKAVESSVLNNPITKATKALVKGVVLSSSTVQSITGSVKGQIVQKGKWKQTLDNLQAEGVKSFMLDKSTKGKNNPNAELHKQVNSAIVAGYDADMQALLAKETKTLSDMDKKIKRLTQMEVGAYFTYIRNQLKKRETDSVKNSTEKASPVDMYFKDLQSALDRLAKLEDVDFSVVEHKKSISNMLQDK